MLRNYQPLPFTLLAPGAGYVQPTQSTLERVQLDSPATDVMTDLTHVTAVIVLAGDTVDEAFRRMVQRGVRMLLVVDQDRKVLGVITALDISGEKPVQIAVQQGIHRDEVLVRNCMTPCSNLQVLSMDQVRAAKVGHIVATLRHAGRQHTLVVERGDRNVQRLRGIFSTTQIVRQLGMTIQTNVVANTFAEIEAQLSR
ncbi:MAG TPA: CBS domain-containing protein [Burkholderiales bacterium]|nr:CBS domain-containing protein [Burkholderiales bacterium]